MEGKIPTFSFVSIIALKTFKAENLIAKLFDEILLLL